MTGATKVFLAQLRQHIGGNTAKRQALRKHCSEALQRPVPRETMHKIEKGGCEPGADLLIPIMRWLQLEGVIKPGAKSVGLFIYTRPLRATVAGKRSPVGGATKQPNKGRIRPALKAAKAA